MKELDFNLLEQALDMLGQLLEDRKQHCEVVAIGGGSLLLLGQTARPTRDLYTSKLKNRFFPALASLSFLSSPSALFIGIVPASRMENLARKL